MKKEKTSSPNDNEEKGTEVFKDFDFSKLTRSYIELVSYEELIKIYCSRPWQEWFNQPHLKENPLKPLILDIIARKEQITQKVCLNVLIDEIVLISKNSEDLDNLVKIVNLFNLDKIVKTYTTTPRFIIRIFDNLLKKQFIENVGIEATSTRPAQLFSISSRGIRHLFYYLLPHDTPEDLSTTIAELADEFMAFLEAYPPLNTHNRIDLASMLQFSPKLFEFFKMHYEEFVEGVILACEQSLGSPLPRQFCNFPDKGCFEYSGPEAQALDKVCFLEGSITTMSPPQTKIVEVETWCRYCRLKKRKFVRDNLPRLVCEGCGENLIIVNKASKDFLVFNLRTSASTFDFTVEASCQLVSEIQQIFEKNKTCSILAVLKSRPTKKGAVVEDFYYSLVAIAPSLKEIEIDDSIAPIPLKNLVSRFCPAVVGLGDAKLGLLASIVRSGRPRKDRLNLLLAGDPGTGKSFLFAEAQKYLAWLPCGLVDGGNSSAVGVLGGAVRSDAGGWSIVRGSLAQASGGLLFVEELTSLPSEVLDKFKQSLESGAIVISKAGLAVSFQAETSLVASCNACKGFFDKSRPLSTQIPISSAMLDRFDSKITIFKGDVSPAVIAKKMVSSSTETAEDVAFLTSYLRRAHSLNPTFDEGAQLFFSENATLPPRQMRAVKNFALGLAQLRFSDDANTDDVVLALNFIQKFNRCFFGCDESNGYHLESSAIKVILSLLNDGPMPEKELLKKLNPADKTLIVETLRHLEHKGNIYRTAKGWGKVV